MTDQVNGTSGSALVERIDNDLKQAMRDKNEVAKLTLRSVKTALTEARTSGAEHSLSEAEVLAVVQKEAKRRRDAAAEYERVGAQLHKRFRIYQKEI